ncbi:MAG: response regulator transcription factor [Flavobacteriales bacterium]|nr:response regulator transcription factor [Flavobacteriales bacterium]
MKSEIINGKSTIIVDDHLLFTNGLTGILEDIGLKVHSTFSNAKDAITYLKNQNVDIIFSDINMPRMDGIQFCKRLKKLQIETPVIMLSMYEDANIIKESFNHGAAGYLSKNSDRDEIIKALTNCLNGKEFVNKNLLKEDKISSVNKDKYQTKYSLSTREREVLGHILNDEKNSVIADLLNISKRTIETHRKNIMVKLDVKTPVALAQLAIKYKLTTTLKG